LIELRDHFDAKGKTDEEVSKEMLSEMLKGIKFFLEKEGFTIDKETENKIKKDADLQKILVEKIKEARGKEG
jgi:hypothetical protein